MAEGHTHPLRPLPPPPTLLSLTVERARLAVVKRAAGRIAAARQGHDARLHHHPASTCEIGGTITASTHHSLDGVGVGIGRVGEEDALDVAGGGGGARPAGVEQKDDGLDGDFAARLARGESVDGAGCLMLWVVVGFLEAGGGLGVLAAWRGFFFLLARAPLAVQYKTTHTRAP